MQSRFNHTMALARASLHYGENTGSIRAAMEEAKADRLKTLQELIEAKKSEQAAEEQLAKDQARMSAYMQDAAARVEAQRAEHAARLEEAIANQPPEHDILNALGTSAGGPEVS